MKRYFAVIQLGIMFYGLNWYCNNNNNMKHENTYVICGRLMSKPRCTEIKPILLLLDLQTK